MPSGGYDGSITFYTGLDNKKLEKQLAGLSRKIERKAQDISRLTQKRDVIKGNSLFDGSVLDAEKAKLQEIRDRLADVRAMAKDRSLGVMQREEAKELIPSLREELADQRSRVSGLQSEWNKLQSAAERYDARIAEATAELERQKRAAGRIQEQLDGSAGGSSQERMAAYLEKNSALYQRAAGLLGKTADVSAVLEGLAGVTGGKLSGAFQTAGAAVGSFGTALSGMVAKAAPFLAVATAIFGILKKLWSAAKDFAVGFTSALKRGAAAVYSFGSAVARNFVAALKAIGRLSGSFAKTIAGITKNIIQLTKRLNVFSRMAETLGGVVKQLGSTIKSALVFSVIYKGLSLLREQVGAYLMVNGQFSAALRRLQGVLLTAFQPIYDVVVPALAALVNALTHAIAVLAQFFAGLFGTTAKKAQANAKALYGEAKALKAAGKAAEEAAGSLAGFDEINQIQTEDRSGGGGGGGTPDTGAIFDYEYEETPFASWGEAFSAFLDDMLAAIPRLEDVLQRFADALNGWAQKVYDMFTFPGVLDKVKQLGADLADALNGLVDAIEWELLGQALGAGLNLALNLLTSFLYGFDWMNLGRGLAALVNGLVSEIDWYEFGRLLWAGFKIGLETLAGFLLGLDMTQLARAAGSIVQGFFDEMYNTIAGINWQEIGRQLARFLNNIDWYGSITSALTAIQAAIIALAALVMGFVDELDWTGIARKIYTAINASLDQIDWAGIGKVMGDAFTHIFDFVRDVVSGLNWYVIGQNIADLILGFDFAGALGSLADALAAGINAAIQLAGGLLGRLGPEAQGIAEGIAERLRNAVESVEWGALGGVIGDGIKTALGFIAGLLDPELFSEIGKAIGDFLVGLDWPGLVGGLAEVLANGIDSAVAAVQGFLGAVQPNLREIALDIAEKINEFVETVDWAELGQTLADCINSAVAFLLPLLKKIDWESIWDSAITFINEAINNTDWKAVGDLFGETLKAKIEGVKELLRNADWAGIVRAIVDFLAGIDWVSLAGDITECLFELLGAAVAGVIALILDLPKILKIGAEIVGGIKKGIVDAVIGIPGWLKNHLIDPVVEGVKDLLGIHSPSTVFAEIGENTIGGLFKGIEDSWKSITDFFDQKLEALKKSLSDTWKNIKTTAAEKWKEIKESTLGKTWDSIRDNAKKKFDETAKKVSDAWASVKKDSPGKWNEIKTSLATSWDQIKRDAGEKFRSTKDTIIQTLDGLKNHGWRSIGETVVNGIVGGLQTIWNTLTGWARDVKNTISDAVSEANRGRSGGFGVSVPAGSFGGRARVAVQAVPDISTFEVPALAQGAVIPPNREFLAVLGDQGNGKNLEAPEGLIRQIFQEELGSTAELLRAILEAVRSGHKIMVNDVELGRTAIECINKSNKAAGKQQLDF